MDGESKRQEAADATAPRKKKARSRTSMATTQRQKNDSKTRQSRDVSIKKFAHHVKQTSLKDGSAENYRALLCFDNSLTDAAAGGGRDMKGSLLREEPQFIALGHRLKDSANLRRWASRLLKVADALDAGGADVTLVGQRSTNEITVDAKKLITDLHNGRGVVQQTRVATQRPHEL